jgi:hypothetical protein
MASYFLKGCMMKKRWFLSVVMIMAVMVLTVSGCGGGGNGGGVSTDTSSESGVETPNVRTVYIDEDPASPIAATVMFDEGDHQIERLDFFGPKLSSGNPPNSALIYTRDGAHTFRVDFNSTGEISTLYLGEIGNLEFDFNETTMNLTYIAPDGTTSLKSIQLEKADLESAQTGQAQSNAAAAANISDAPSLGAWVEINRAVYVDVTIGSDSDPLPNHLAVPSLNQIECWDEYDTDAINYDCRAVAPQLIKSGDWYRTYRLTMLHRASGVIPGIEPADWPSLEACEDAINGDFYVNAYWTASLEATAVTIAHWLKGEAVAAGVKVASLPAAAVLILKGTAVTGVAVACNWIGNQAYHKIWGRPLDCENMKQRFVAESAIGLGAASQEFTNQVSMDKTLGWTLDSSVKEIEPYQPFSAEMATTVGDLGSLDNNQLPDVDFIATKSEFTSNWTNWPNPEYCPAESSGDSQYQAIDVNENVRALCTYSSVGTLSEEDIYLDGKRYGWFKSYFYFENQQRLMLQRPYSKNGKANGLTTEYHLSNGFPRLMYTFVDDVLNGEYKQLSEDGALVACTIYENDQPAGSCMP